MFKKIVNFIVFLFCITAFSVLSASADCKHNFAPGENNTNLIVYGDMTHSYDCLNGCGSIGTVSGGLNSKEQCTFYLASEKEADCVSTGEKIYVCKICLLSKKVTLPVKKHSYSTVRRLPTCTENGYDLHTCKFCGKKYKDNIVKPIDHLSDGGILETLPTVSSTGSMKISCRICGSSLGRKTVPKIYKAEKTPGKVSSFKVKSYDSSSVKLAWKKTENASSYKVCYSTDKKKWKTLSTAKTAVTVKKLKSSEKYYFKIRAVGNSYEGETGKIISACTAPAKAALTNIKSAKKSTATLTWKKQSNVSGYEINYSAKAFSKKKNIKTVKITKGTKMTLKKLKSGKKYYFRIRAYKTYGANRIYGEYSKTKTLKIK